MVLGYRARFATRDVDALFEPRERIHRAALEVAEEMGLPRWWLNDPVDQVPDRLDRVTPLDLRPPMTAFRLPAMAPCTASSSSGSA